MNFYFKAELWDEDDKNIPHTSKLARPVAWERVSNTTVIELVGAAYRGAVFDGVFALDERYPIKTNKQGWNEAIFFCCWFGHRLKTRGIKIAYNPATAKMIKGYSGEVAKNLSL